VAPFPDSSFRWKNKRLACFVIPAKAGIQKQIQLLIELFSLCLRVFVAELLRLKGPDAPMKGVPMKKIYLCISALFLFLSVHFPAAASDERAEAPPSASEHQKSGFNPGQWLISQYSRHISAVDGDRCPSFPTCGSYSAKAFKKHGFFMGWMMTVDRLIHEGKSETEVSPLVYSGGRWKTYDPVENNDFWWYTEDKEAYE
jgi:hypothetical protein